MTRRRLATVRKSPVASAAHGPLLDAIAASPGDPASWAVYADLLQTEDHPRGELISLMLERERQPSARLYELQRQHLAGVPVSATLGAEAVLAWRRGFPSELRLDDPEQLRLVLADPALRFVEAAVLVVDDWSTWRAALAETRMPGWLRLSISTIDTAIETAMVFACAPDLTSLRVAFDDDGTIAWDDTQAPALERLAVVNCVEQTGFDDAELPNLADVRLLGRSVVPPELRTSAVWGELERVMLGTEEANDDEDDEDEDDVRVSRMASVSGDRASLVDAYPDDYAPSEATAFVALARPLETALLRRLAERMAMDSIGVRIVRVRDAFTVLQYYGSGDAHAPYQLALALQNVLDPPPPIALVEVDATTGRYLVLEANEARLRGKHERPEDAARRALDAILGRDFGTDVLDDIREELAIAPIQALIGTSHDRQLTQIDPATAPLYVPEEPDDDHDDEEEDEDDDEYWAQYEDETEAFVDEPPPLALAMPITAAEVEIEVLDDDPIEPETQIDADGHQPPTDLDAPWLEFRDHYEDRAIAIDDEPGELRWPDPIRIHVEQQIAEPACARHQRLLDHCNACGAAHCVECGGEGVCSACFVATAFDTDARLPIAT